METVPPNTGVSLVEDWLKVEYVLDLSGQMPLKNMKIESQWPLSANQVCDPLS